MELEIRLDPCVGTFGHSPTLSTAGCEYHLSTTTYIGLLTPPPHGEVKRLLPLLKALGSVYGYVEDQLTLRMVSLCTTVRGRQALTALLMHRDSHRLGTGLPVCVCVLPQLANSYAVIWIAVSSPPLSLSLHLYVCYLGRLICCICAVMQF